MRPNTNLLLSDAPYRRALWLAIAWWGLVDSPPNPDRTYAFWVALSRGCSYTDPPPWDQWILADRGLVQLPIDILAP